MILFRNWSVGVGEVGDMHINPQTYNRVLADLDSPHLIVSTKHTMGDFFSYLPCNPTLKSGKQTRLVEFQARREFEGFGSLPNYMGMPYREALLELCGCNSRIEGIWLWTQRGGPLRAGPLSLYPFYGFWNFTDANVYVMGRLAWDPKVDMQQVTETWVRSNVGNDPQAIDSMTRLLLISHEAILNGLYVSSMANKQVLAFGLQPPPTPWMWDIVSGCNSVLSIVYFGSRDNLQQAVEGGFKAVREVWHMKDLARDIKPDSPQAVKFRSKLLESLAYEENLFDTLAWYRKAFLAYYHWVDRGDSESLVQWRRAFARFQARKDVHLRRYDRNLDFPAYNFFAADAGMAHVQRTSGMMWLARALLTLSLTFLAFCGTIFHRSFDRCPGSSGLREMGTALFAPWSLRRRREWSLTDYLAVSFPFALFCCAVLTFSSFRSVYYPLWLLASLVIFTTSLLLASSRKELARVSIAAAVAAPLLYLTVLFMAVVSVRGPLYLWFLFWTADSFRILFLTLGFAALTWVFFTVYATARTNRAISGFTALGDLLFAIGAVCIADGLAAGLFGLEQCLTALNNEMAIVPLSLSKVLGITTHLNIDPNLPECTMGAGFVLLILGFGMRHLGPGSRAANE